MASDPKTQGIDEQLAETAAEWALSLEDGQVTGEKREQFRQWLAQSSAHWQAYHNARATIEEIDDLGKMFDIDTLAADRGKGFTAGARRAPRRKWMAGLAMAASLLLAVVGYWYFYDPADRAMVYATAVGQQRQVRLADDTVIHLNTRSKVAVEFAPQVRHVTLLEGEALFDVAHDATRPFTVFVRDAEVSVLGTQFNVYKKQDGPAAVSVLEGRVKVAFINRNDVLPGGQKNKPVVAFSKTPQPVYLEAGSQAVIDSVKHELSQARVDVDRQVAWRTGKLVFNQQPLLAVTEEFNRYNERRLIVSGTELKELKITGTFDPYDVDTFIKTLHPIMQVQATKVNKMVTLLSRERN